MATPSTSSAGTLYSSENESARPMSVIVTQLPTRRTARKHKAESHVHISHISCKVYKSRQNQAINILGVHILNGKTINEKKNGIKRKFRIAVTGGGWWGAGSHVGNSKGSCQMFLQPDGEQRH